MRLLSKAGDGTRTFAEFMSVLESLIMLSTPALRVT